MCFLNIMYCTIYLTFIGTGKPKNSLTGVTLLRCHFVEMIENQTLRIPEVRLCFNEGSGTSLRSSVTRYQPPAGEGSSVVKSLSSVARTQLLEPAPAQLRGLDMVLRSSVPRCGSFLSAQQQQFLGFWGRLNDFIHE